MTNSIARPDVNKVMRGLKDFQRKTVDFVFRRMYTDPDPTRRFLIADEVGLGKTLVARGLIAQAIDHLWDYVDRIDVVYICSNGDIARQNVNRLNITDQADFALASRITLLPTEISDLKHNKLNFVSFTPGTSFDLKSSMGQGNERVVLYWLLRRAWGLRGIAPLNVLKGTMGAERFRHRVDEFDESRLDEALAEAFVGNLAAHVQQAMQQGQPDLRTRFDELCAVYSRADRNVSYESQRQRSALVGELRALLARTCLRALEPDLIILDEFQRFKHLLQGDDEASMLAQGLFSYSDEHSSARVLLLSATPYKMYTQSHEADDDHYQDFMKTLRFLTPEARDAQALEGQIAEYRRELFRIGTSETQRLIDVRDQLQAGLRRVMVRTERLAVSQDRDGMLTEVPGDQNKLESKDLEAYLALAAVAEVLEESNPLEYWKSAPYLLNFMDEYDFKESFEAALEDTELAPRLAQALAARPSTLLPWVSQIRQYVEVDPGNSRLRGLLAETIGQGAWQCLWLPPSLPYYQLGGPFANPVLTGFTKRLVFSAWRVVPKVISLLLSYEAERRMVRSFDAEALNTPEDREKRRPLLRFARTEGRLTGLPVLGLIYP
jgi:hypothetical protein